MKKVKRLHRTNETIRANHAALPPSQTSSFLLEMFKYVANMLMLMNGAAAISLLNKDPSKYGNSIIALATGCLVPATFYAVAYFAYCDMLFPNSRHAHQLEITRCKYFKIATYCIMLSFVFSIIAFCTGLVMFLS